MMKHMKLRLIALLWVTFAVVCTWASDSVVWHHPVVGYTHSIVEVTKVVLHADRTEVSCHVHYPSGYWIQILRTTELQADGRNFPVRDASGIPLGERYTMPESDEVDFTLTFDAVPLGTVKMNLVEPGGWTVYNIRPEDYRSEGIEDTYWRDVRTGDWFVGFSGDGVIVCTPTGSTAYSMSAGGPIIEPSAKNLLLTPICAHAMLAKSIVLGPRRVVTIRVSKIGRHNAFLSVDGGRAFRLNTGDEITVKSSQKVTRLVRLKNTSFFEILNRKFIEKMR